MDDLRSSKLKTLSRGDDPRPEASNPGASLPQVESLSSALQQLVEEPRTIEATRIPQPFLADLALKVLYFGGLMQGGQVAQALRLHFSGVAEPILRALKAQHLVEVVGGSTLNPVSYQYTITDKGG